jgi:hypothetical protein
MIPSHDELAGVVDLFGGLTHDELVQAFRDLAARREGDFEPRRISESIEEARCKYYLVEFDHDGATLLVAGPTALPTLPAGGEDLPYLLSSEPRVVPRDTLARLVEERLRGEAARAVAADDGDRMNDLLDICYDADAWAPIDTSDIRERLAAALD